MIDEFADFILQLNEKARELLESATNLDTELDDKLGAPDQDRLARIQELMNKLCSGMTRGRTDSRSPVIGSRQVLRVHVWHAHAS